MLLTALISLARLQDAQSPWMILSETRVSGARQLHIARLDGRQRMPLRRDGVLTDTLFAGFMPGGNRLQVIEFSSGSYGALSYRGEYEPITQPRALVSQIGWTGDGCCFLYTAYDLDNVRQIYVVDWATRTESILPLDIPAGWDGIYPQGWTPERDAFFVEVNGDLYRISADGRQQQRLTEGNGGYRRIVTYAPDGEHVLVRDTDRTSLQLMRYTGEFEEPIAYGIFADWSPDGKWMLYYTMDFDLRRVRLDGSEDQAITQTAGINEQSAFWIDAGIVYIRQSGSSRELRIMQADGSGDRLLIAAVDFLQPPRDFDTFLYYQMGQVVYRIPVVGGNPQQITPSGQNFNLVAFAPPYSMPWRIGWLVAVGLSGVVLAVVRARLPE